MKNTTLASITQPAIAAGAIRTLALCLCALFITCCSSDKADQQAVITKGKDIATAPTTGTATHLSESQVDYFSERYLPAQERLRRRQDRIKDVLK